MQNILKKYGFRITVSAFGVIMIGISVGFFRISSFGTDPFTVLNLGLSNIMNIQFGTVQLIMQVLLFIPVLTVRRDLIGFGTICNMVFSGYIADFTVFGVQFAFGEINNIIIRAIFLVTAVLLAYLGVAFYIKADMGISPYDAFGYVLESLTHGKIQFRYSRIICDALSVIIGVTLGAILGITWSIFGIGTLVMATMSGPMIQFFIDKVAGPFVDRFNKSV